MSENEEIKRAKEELDKISQDEHERWLAEMREKAIMDEIALRKTGYNEGKAEGINERNIEIAKNMLKENIDINLISKVTGLSIEDISNIEE